MTSKCGTCTACCKVYAIPELQKPAGTWCRHCIVGVGCSVYDTRPQPCVTYKCMWLLTQDFMDKGMAFELRPDQCKVVIGPSTDPNTIVFSPLTGYWDAWRKVPGILSIIKRIAKGGQRAVIDTADITRKIVVDKYGEREITMTLPDENGTQWYAGDASG